ncbi:hypothetical protein [Sphingosinicella soli]|uniref:Uncharacterized protein n=1 Tax=Sphingosinicella soli TaxID=333708 RepID=A0A7W7F702_9SPHN|nr:hypothetical protein [Sphingosinicella soli]MBB4632901.1 hypothetical protein [Sphingosinicella soli]
MRRVAVSALLLALSSHTALAQSAPGEKDKPTLDRALDAAAQPVEDINLKKDEIPQELIDILDDPYSLKGIRKCSQVRTAVETLDAVLGPDLDVEITENKGKKRADTVLRLSGNFLSNLILPFRGIVREISGSAENKRRYQAAIITGVARRSFLKGYGASKGCKPPAAPLPISAEKAEAQASRSSS